MSEDKPPIQVQLQGWFFRRIMAIIFAVVTAIFSAIGVYFWNDYIGNVKADKVFNKMVDDSIREYHRHFYWQRAAIDSLKKNKADKKHH